MFNWTKEERLVLLLFVAVLLTGSMLHYTFKKYPEVQDYVNFVDSDRAYPKLDINKASHQEFVDIPYIGEYTAGEILSYREEHGLFASLEELKLIKGIKEKNYEKFSKYLKVN